jgi:hypothetical protein
MIQEDLLEDLIEIIDRKINSRLLLWDARFVTLERQIELHFQRLTILETVLAEVIRVLNKVVNWINHQTQ